MRTLLPLLALALVPAALAAQPPATAAAEAPIVAEARAFMEGYGEELRLGDRSALADRYDRNGAWRVGPARTEFQSWADIEANYRRRWAAPASFEWRGLAYEPAGPDAVVVVGRFLWWPPKAAERGKPLDYSYTALLLRRDGRLRIRVEDEAAAVPSSRR
ncbi:MAG TPA: hypothetical protein VFZ91_12695 [Allosphingosinicella sp.]